MLAGAVPEKKKDRKKKFPGSYSEIKQNSVGPGNKKKFQVKTQHTLIW
jgi:hypothetical protein